MHEVAEGEIYAIERPIMLFFYTEEHEIMELADAKTKPLENHQDNGATLMVNTQPSLLHSPPEDTLVASDEFPPRPCIEAG